MIFLFSAKVSKNYMIKPLLIGLIVSVVSSLIIVAICAIAATNLAVSDEAILIMALVSMSLGAFIGGISAAKMLKEKGFLIGALNGAAFFLLTTIIAFIVNQNAITMISLIKLLVFTLASMVGGVIGVNITHKRSF